MGSRLFPRVIVGRLIIAFLFEVITIFYQFKYTPYTFSPNLLLLYGIFGAIITVSGIYIFLHRKGFPDKKNFYIQFFLDSLFITSLVYLTGGSESPLTFLYILLIIASSIVLAKRGAIFGASVSTIFYGALLDLQYFDYITPVFIWIDEPALFTKSELFYKILLHLFAFFITAILSGYLSERYKKTSGEIDFKEIDKIAKAIPSSIPSGVIVLRDNNVVYMNKAAENILGINLIQIYKKPLPPVFPFELVEGVRKESEVFINSRKRIFGYSVIEFLRDEPLKLILFQDITEIKKKEKEMKINEKFIALGRMAGIMAHEIRNPLGSITGAAQLIREKVGDEKVKRMANIMMEECKRLEEILTRFINLSTLEFQKKEKLELIPIIEDSFLIMTQNLEKIKVEKIFPPQRLLITGDKNLLKEAFINILKNSIEAMPEGGSIKVEVSVEGEEVKIRFMDTGPGIPENIRDKVFEPFFTTKHSGTGLGLAITYRIVELHGGTINIESPPSRRGTSVVISLPLEPSSETPG